MVDDGAATADRPLATTVADTLAWWGKLPEIRQMNLKTGLTREREAAVLARLG